uniref:Uncharacterized protein LOC104247638 n=1 Tax=Nicotiana sylvestris TaxID=4096 RepID=A0A1U7YJ67_NICSY|nr:PREDICTED: uncharacterized protein LOC104247638 [Nicotiana sylvestris]
MGSTDFDVTSASGTLEFVPKPSSPLFVQSSDVPGVSLVPVPFSGTNFGGWKRTIIVSLYARKKLRLLMLHGFPPDFKFTKGKKITANATIGTDFSSDDCINSFSLPVAGTTNNDSQGSLVPGLTKNQYSQLMAFLQYSHASDSTPSQFDLMASVNFAGNVLIPKVVTCSLALILSQSSPNKWIIDFGVSDHMTYNNDLLTNITPLPILYLVTLPNGYKVKVTCTESLYPSIILLDVLYIPSFKHNLISVNKLVLLLTCIPQFCSDSCLLQGPSLKMPLELGKQEDGLYKDKLRSRMITCVFLGYLFSKKGYKLYNLETKQFFVSRDVVFHEEVFLFSSSSHVFQTPISFPPLSPPSDSFPFPPSTHNYVPLTYVPTSPMPASPPSPTPDSPSLPSDPIPSLVPDLTFSPIPSNPTPPVIPSHVPTTAAPIAGPLGSSGRTHHLPPHLSDYVCHFPPSLSCITTLTPPVSCTYTSLARCYEERI